MAGKTLLGLCALFLAGAAMACLDEHGTPVDWWFAYKVLQTGHVAHFSGQIAVLRVLVCTGTCRFCRLVSSFFALTDRAAPARLPLFLP
jgi:hypothetical protein